jgi:hypothetical protein
MKVLVALLLLSVLSVRSTAQQDIKPLTADEKLSIRTPQNERTEALSKLDKQALAVYLDAEDRIQKAFDAIYSVRKISPKEYTLCEGPGLPMCKDAPAHDLSLVKVPEKKPTVSQPGVQ